MVLPGVLLSTEFKYSFQVGFRDELEVRFSDMKAKELRGLCIFYHVCMI